MEVLKKSGFKLIEDGSILAGYGTAHFGMVQIKVWIENTTVDRIEFILSLEQNISLTYNELYQIRPHLFRSPYDEEI